MNKLLWTLLCLSLCSCIEQLNGPVVGIPVAMADGEHFSCKISLHPGNWEQHRPIFVRLREQDKSEYRDVLLTAMPRYEYYPTPPPRTAVLSNLAADTRYFYEILVDRKSVGERQRWSGQFSTPPRQSRPFRVALASCMRYRHDSAQNGWHRVVAMDPDFALLLGDNVYANTPDHSSLWGYHRQQRAVENFRQLLLRTPIAAIWDDHDYGPNNSNGELPGKEHSLAAFREIWWTNPAHGTRDIPGAFYRFSWGDVHFFVIDGRYYRSEQSAENATMLGERQLHWLLDELQEQQRHDEANGTKSFKILLSGSPLTDGRDSWYGFAAERLHLFSEITRAGIDGVFYCAGDAHFSYMLRHGLSIPGSYPIHEIVSSGIANDTSRWGYTKSFVTLDFDTTDEDWRKHQVRIAIHGEQDFLARISLREKTVVLSDLVVDDTAGFQQGKFLYDQKSREYQRRRQRRNVYGPFSAPLGN